MMKYSLLAVLGISAPLFAQSTVYNFKELGGKADNAFASTAKKNKKLWNSIMSDTLKPGDTLWFPKDERFYMMGGIQATGLRNVTFVFDGSIVFADDSKFLKPKKYMKNWPRDENGKVLDCISFQDVEGVTFTSTNGPNGGLLYGGGGMWWSIPFLGYLFDQENRPKLFVLKNSTDALFENIVLKNSPYWSFWAPDSEGLEIRDSTVDVRRTAFPGTNSHNLIQLSAFNTDGFDVSGNNVWIHDVNIWNQDDCIAVKGPKSTNMVFERITASGMGLTIGSIGGGEIVKNITFRDSNMPKTKKGIYIKYRSSADQTSLISDVLYKNITMNEPSRAIWIGPAQQSDSNNPCAAHPCSLCWPWMPGVQCNPPEAPIVNITLKDILIINPKASNSVIYGNDEVPIENIELDNVMVLRIKKPSDDSARSLQQISIEENGQSNKKLGYICPDSGVKNGEALGTTTPIPHCLMGRRDSVSEDENVEDTETIQQKTEL